MRAQVVPHAGVQPRVKISVGVLHQLHAASCAGLPLGASAENAVLG